MTSPTHMLPVDLALKLEASRLQDVIVEAELTIARISLVFAVVRTRHSLAA